MKEKLMDMIEKITALHIVFALWSPGLWLFSRAQETDNPLTGWLSAACYLFSLYATLKLDRLSKPASPNQQP